MKAAILKTFGTPLSVEQLPDPRLGTGEVLVDIIAAPVHHYANEVFSGMRKYLLELPIVPGAGAVGRVLALGPDATHLSVGDWILCDPTVRSRDDVMEPDITLQGASARGEGGLQLQQYYHNGSFAEKMIIPTENAFKIDIIDSSDAAKWCTANLMLVPYGGLLSVNLQAGETVVISGATGNFGSAGVAVALAMGAGYVIVLGRNEKVLNDLVQRFGHRIRPVLLTGDETTDRENILQATPAPIDCALDILPPTVGTAPVRTAMMTVRQGGRVVLMGGVGMLGGESLQLPYPWIMRNNITIRGQWMYPREAPQKIISLIKSGLLSLDNFQITEFKLDSANEAVEFAAANSGAFKLTVIKP